MRAHQGAEGDPDPGLLSTLADAAVREQHAELVRREHPVPAGVYLAGDGRWHVPLPGPDPVGEPECVLRAEWGRLCGLSAAAAVRFPRGEGRSCAGYDHGHGGNPAAGGPLRVSCAGEERGGHALCGEAAVVRVDVDQLWRVLLLDGDLLADGGGFPLETAGLQQFEQWKWEGFWAHSVRAGDSDAAGWDGEDVCPTGE
uniref:(northern house mosquito) hypothetical protein n=1 Tax=Culex pipiens TaxID=7175 RepID=A0A8D8AU02_CULPI